MDDARFFMAIMLAVHVESAGLRRRHAHVTYTEGWFKSAIQVDMTIV